MINFEEEERISRFLRSGVKHLSDFDEWSRSFISRMEKSTTRISQKYHTRFAELIRSHKIHPNKKAYLMDGLRIWKN